MKLIFSRKGFDSSAGRVASPIVDGRPITLPIPTGMPSRTRYRDLSDPLPELVRDLTRGRIGSGDPCHLDPDLDARVTRAPRRRGWRGCLGQVSAAQSHLEHQGVTVGDVFVFWGLFRSAGRAVDGRWRFVGPREHRIFGWLQVDEVLALHPDPEAVLKTRPWLEGHPHVSPGWPEHNTLYVASKRLMLDGETTGLPGFGMLRRGRRLTADGAKRVTEWSVPGWLDPTRGGVGMTYHPAARWLADGRLRAAARGQEFVADVTRRPDALEWLRRLIEEDA